DCHPQTIKSRIARFVLTLCHRRPLSAWKELRPELCAYFGRELNCCHSRPRPTVKGQLLALRGDQHRIRDTLRIHTSIIKPPDAALASGSMGMIGPRGAVRSGETADYRGLSAASAWHHWGIFGCQ